MSKPKVVIEVKGGVIQEIRSDTAMDVLVVDYDNITQGDEPSEWDIPKEMIDFDAERKAALE